MAARPINANPLAETAMMDSLAGALFFSSCLGRQSELLSLPAEDVGREEGQVSHELWPADS